MMWAIARESTTGTMIAKETLDTVVATQHGYIP